MSDFIIILCTVPSNDMSVKIAKTLVEEELAACVNITDKVTSIYKWKGEICNDEEYLLIIKSRRPLFDTVMKKIVSLHPYEVPEVISLPIIEGLEEYLSLIRGNTKN